MHWIHFILVIIVTLEASTSEKGSKNVKNCGHHFLNSRSKYKSYGGRQLKVNEYPWIAAIKWNLTVRGQIIDNVLCSGVLISPKHVLTAAHCVLFINDTSYNLATPNISKVRPFEGDCSEIRKKRIVSHPLLYSILVGSQCVDPRNCSIKPVQPVKIYFIEDFNECNGDDDLALFELRDEVSDQVATPICLPTRTTKLSRSLKMAGAGITAPPINDTYHYNGFQVVNVSFVRLMDNMIATAMPPGAGLCGGDSGGPLFQSDSNGVSTLVGIASNGESCYNNYNKSIPPGKPWNPCDNDKKNITDFSTDVRVFLDWICDNSGICPEQNSKEAELYEREHSIDFCGEAQSSPEKVIKKPFRQLATFLCISVVPTH